MRIAFRTDASAQIGSGHAMRCLTLADALKKRGAQTVFVTRVLPPALKQQIGNHGHELLLLEERHAIAGSGDLAHSDWLGVPQEIDAADTRRALGERGLDWIVVDHYALDKRWEAALRPATARMMVIDDLADRAHDCDLLLDQNFRTSHEGRYGGLVPQHCILKLGPEFALLQEDYARLRAQVRPRERLRRLLIYFGGGDTGPLTGMALEAALQLGSRDLSIDIVGPSDPVERERLGRLAAGNPAITLHDTLPSLAPMMAQADLAIGGSGATNWERLCLGLPAVVVALAANQVAIARDLHEAGLVVLAGSVDEIGPDSILDAMGCNITDLNGRSMRCMTVCDGVGTARIMDALQYNIDQATLNDGSTIRASRADSRLQQIQLTFRDATIADAVLIFDWRNDLKTRRMSRKSDPIDWATHILWFQDRIQRTQPRLYIFEEDGVPVGTVRLDPPFLSYTVAPDCRGRGIGSRMLTLVRERFGAMTAEVQAKNEASIRAAQKAGHRVVIIPDGTSGKLGEALG